MTFVLIPGAGGAAWYWHRVVPLLEAAGHAAIAVDLPADDERSGLPSYVDAVVAAIGGRRGLVLVAQSLGGFTAPLVCARVEVGMLVFVNAMIPVSGETAGEWGAHTGSDAARKEAAHRGGYSTTFEVDTYFMHDLPPEIAASSASHDRNQSNVVFEEPCQFEAWPDVPIHVIAGRDDRLFPLTFQRRVAWDRLHVSADEVPGGHLVALSHPRELAEQILRYV